MCSLLTLFDLTLVKQVQVWKGRGERLVSRGDFLQCWPKNSGTFTAVD